MTVAVDLDAQLRENAYQLERILALGRRALAKVVDEEERSRRAFAIEQVSRYVALLSRPTSAGRSLYCFKLEFLDGRWNVDEKELPAAPRVGDLVCFDVAGQWRVRGSQLVRPRPARKPQREFFVCAPAA